MLLENFSSPLVRTGSFNSRVFNRTSNSIVNSLQARRSQTICTCRNSLKKSVVISYKIKERRETKPHNLGYDEKSLVE